MKNERELLSGYFSSMPFIEAVDEICRMLNMFITFEITHPDGTEVKDDEILDYDWWFNFLEPTKGQSIQNHEIVTGPTLGIRKAGLSRMIKRQQKRFRDWAIYRNMMYSRGEDFDESDTWIQTLKDTANGKGEWAEHLDIFRDIVEFPKEPTKKLPGGVWDYKAEFARAVKKLAPLLVAINDTYEVTQIMSASDIDDVDKNQDIYLDDPDMPNTEEAWIKYLNNQGWSTSDIENITKDVKRYSKAYVKESTLKEINRMLELSGLPALKESTRKPTKNIVEEDAVKLSAEQFEEWWNVDTNLNFDEEGHFAEIEMLIYDTDAGNKNPKAAYNELSVSDQQKISNLVAILIGSSEDDAKKASDAIEDEINSVHEMLHKISDIVSQESWSEGAKQWDDNPRNFEMYFEKNLGKFKESLKTTIEKYEIFTDIK